jgi:hypothetical protein
LWFNNLGKLTVPTYGLGNFTAGTMVYHIGVDASGNFMEVPAGSGGGSVGTLQQVTDAGNVTTRSIYADSLVGTKDAKINSITAGQGKASDGTNTVFGFESGMNFVSGNARQNSAFGWNAMKLVTNAGFSAAFGYNALSSVTTGGSNTALGRSTLPALTTGQQNTAVGSSAGFGLITGTKNTFVGESAGGLNVDGNNNTLIGANAGYSITGVNNTAIGYRSIIGPISPTSTGWGNTAVGNSSMEKLTTGSNNSALGDSILVQVTTGIGNTGLGFKTGLGITTGSYNTILGANVSGLSATLSNNIIIADGQGNKRIWFNNVGKLTMPTYGLGSFTSGTAAYNIAVDASGNFMEVPTGGGGGTTPNLQAVTDAGAVTTNGIEASNVVAKTHFDVIPSIGGMVARLGNTTDGGSNYGGLLQLKATFSDYAQTLVTNSTLPGNSNLVLPVPLLSNSVLALTVNGVAADVNGNIEVSSGGGGGIDPANYIVREIPSGALNGTNTVFTLANTPVAGKEMVFRNGLLMDSGGWDYTISGNTITFNTPPSSTSRILVTYIK